MCGGGGTCGGGEACVAEGSAWGLCVAGKTVTAAYGTHPTGMHSCLLKKIGALILFVGPLLPLFWTAGAVCPNFQSQGVSLCFCVSSPVCNKAIQCLHEAKATQ